MTIKHGLAEYRRGCRCDVCERAEYQRSWREQNRDHLRAYRKRNRARRAEYHRDWCADNREHLREQKRAYRQKNLERVREQERVGRQRNREHKAESDRKYYRRNREKILARAHEDYDQNRENKIAYQRQHYDQNRDAKLDYIHAYYNQNRDARLEYAREYRVTGGQEKTDRRLAEINSILLAARSGLRWLPQEDAIVLREDLSILEMAVCLERTYAAVLGRRQTLRRSAEDQPSHVLGL